MTNDSGQLEPVEAGPNRDGLRQAEDVSVQMRLLDVTRDSIFVRDKNDAITYWNIAAEQLYGWKREEALGRVTHQLLRTTFPMPLPEIMENVFRTGYWEGELVHTKRDGAQVTVVSRWSLQPPSQESPTMTFEINSDITERRRMEETLAKLQAEMARIARIMTMGELAASLAHEVNQPLAGVLLNGRASLRWLAGDSPQLDEARDAIQRIIRDGNRASDIIARMWAFARKTGTKKGPVDLNDAIQKVIVLAQGEVRRQRVTLRTELAHDLPHVVGDRVQLQQVVLNLVVNGIEAMSALVDRPRKLLIKTQRGKGNQVLVTVEDSGPGLNPEKLDRIFDAFYTTKDWGMGMGLSISRSIIENHGGQLCAIPNGFGSTFQFAL